MIINPYSFGGLDPDAQSFLTASGITDSTISSAINTLVTTMKSDGIWTKMKAIYPFVGGTASTHKWNLKDPRDLDAAFRLTFSGGITHDSNGILPNGTNGYADTFLIPSTTLGLNNSHLSFYSRTNSIAAARSSIGSFNAPAFTSGHVLILKWSDNNSYNLMEALGTASYVNTNSTGLYIASRTANNSLKAYKNNSLAATYTTTIIAVPNTTQIYIGARNESNTAVLYDNKQCAFASIGDGLTDTEAANFYTAVQAFQTTLNRQIV
ncbi:MAG: hypothetical protein ACK459_15220 [Akkermansiaceae bacterium]|jgi:hypothetical protein